jgi:hypothetical protein
MVAFVVVAAIVVSLAEAQGNHSPSATLRKRMALVVDRTLRDGVYAQLPPHISTLLGLTKEQACPVVQGVFRDGTQVQGFDVSTANNNDVIIFVVHEATNDQALYLTSRDGALRKVVFVEQGVGRVEKITADSRKAFEKGRQFWLDRLAPLSAP